MAIEVALLTFLVSVMDLRQLSYDYMAGIFQEYVSYFCSGSGITIVAGILSGVCQGRGPGYVEDIRQGICQRYVSGIFQGSGTVCQVCVSTSPIPVGDRRVKDSTEIKLFDTLMYIYNKYSKYVAGISPRDFSEWNLSHTHVRYVSRI
jgi:hypothetical protein